MGEFACRKFWVSPPSESPEQATIVFHYPVEGRDDLFESRLSIGWPGHQWATKLEGRDPMESLLYLPYISHCYLSWYSERGWKLWWRELGDFDSLAFWAPSEYPARRLLSHVQARPQVTAEIFAIAPGDTTATQLTIGLSGPINNASNCTAALSLTSSSLNDSFEVEALDSMQALMTMLMVGQQVISDRQLDGWKFYKYKPGDLETLELWGAPVERAKQA